MRSTVQESWDDGASHARHPSLTSLVRSMMPFFATHESDGSSLTVRCCGLSGAFSAPRLRNTCQSKSGQLARALGVGNARTAMSS